MYEAVSAVGERMVSECWERNRTKAKEGNVSEKGRKRWERGVKNGGRVDREGRGVNWIKMGGEGTYKRTLYKTPMRLKSSRQHTREFGRRIHKAFVLRA